MLWCDGGGVDLAVAVRCVLCFVCLISIDLGFAQQVCFFNIWVLLNNCFCVCVCVFNNLSFCFGGQWAMVAWCW